MLNLVLKFVRLQSVIVMMLTSQSNAQLTQQSLPILRSSKLNKKRRMLMANQIKVQLRDSKNKAVPLLKQFINDK